MFARKVELHLYVGTAVKVHDPVRTIARGALVNAVARAVVAVVPATASAIDKHCANVTFVSPYTHKPAMARRDQARPAPSVPRIVVLHADGLVPLPSASI